jgi:hypothetical protein
MRQHQQYHRRQHSIKLNNSDYETYPTGGEEEFSPHLSYRMINGNIDSVVDYLSDDESDTEMPAGCVSLLKKSIRVVFLYVEFGYIESGT